MNLVRLKKPSPPKVSWGEYYLNIAKAVSARATCPRASVGAVIVSEQNRIIATGYNGAPSGAPECRDVGCFIVEDHCKRAIHAEANAVLWMSKNASEQAQGATIYIYDSLNRGFACKDCSALLRTIGVSVVITSKGGSSLKGDGPILIQDTSSSTSISFIELQKAPWENRL